LKSLYGIFDFQLMLRYMKSSEKRFNIGFSSFYNFVKCFLTSSYWSCLDRTNRRIFIFNSKYKSLYGIFNSSKFFNFILLKHTIVNRFFFTFMEQRKNSLIAFKPIFNSSIFSNNFFFIFRFLSKKRYINWRK
jgi:hypothetical protein